ncbi:uncharacterized protein [Physcomitrium patens]|uniref:uncharacterized protein n=1 Tax=Physcomitrium patens TaxID=3218 RepID=UPI003CCE34AB
MPRRTAGKILSFVCQPCCREPAIRRSGVGFHHASNPRSRKLLDAHHLDGWRSRSARRKHSTSTLATQTTDWFARGCCGGAVISSRGLHTRRRKVSLSNSCHVSLVGGVRMLGYSIEPSHSPTVST